MYDSVVNHVVIIRIVCKSVCLNIDFQEGLVKSNMDKLTFFAMKSPEKLDRIGEYLALRLSRYIDRQKKG